jgi:hypothetical protein
VFEPSSYRNNPIKSNSTAWRNSPAKTRNNSFGSRCVWIARETLISASYLARRGCSCPHQPYRLARFYSLARFGLPQPCFPGPGLTDSDVDAELREQAAACLLHHFGAKYQHDVVEFARFSPHEIQDLLFRELVSPPHARVSGVDPAVVRIGFCLMFEEMAGNEDRFAHGRVGSSYYGAFLPANQLGTYLGENFTPDYKLPKYQGEHGKEIWYRETVENAFARWLTNKERYAN